MWMYVGGLSLCCRYCFGGITGIYGDHITLNSVFQYRVNKALI